MGFPKIRGVLFFVYMALIFPIFSDPPRSSEDLAKEIYDQLHQKLRTISYYASSEDSEYARYYKSEVKPFMKRNANALRYYIKKNPERLDKLFATVNRYDSNKKDWIFMMGERNVVLKPLAGFDDKSTTEAEFKVALKIMQFLEAHDAKEFFIYPDFQNPNDPETVEQLMRMLKENNYKWAVIDVLLEKFVMDKKDLKENLFLEKLISTLGTGNREDCRTLEMLISKLKIDPRNVFIHYVTDDGLSRRASLFLYAIDKQDSGCMSGDFIKKYQFDLAEKDSLGASLHDRIEGGMTKRKGAPFNWDTLNLAVESGFPLGTPIEGKPFSHWLVEQNMTKLVTPLNMLKADPQLFLEKDAEGKSILRKFSPEVKLDELILANSISKIDLALGLDSFEALQLIAEKSRTKESTGEFCTGELKENRRVVFVDANPPRLALTYKNSQGFNMLNVPVNSKNYLKSKERLISLIKNHLSICITKKNGQTKIEGLNVNTTEKSVDESASFKDKQATTSKSSKAKSHLAEPELDFKKRTLPEQR